jgi:hypothetical protein
MEDMDVSDVSNLTNDEKQSSSRYPVEIVCIYAQIDETFYTDLKKTLVLWERQGNIVWLEVQPGHDIPHTLQLFLKASYPYYPASQP